MGILTGTGTVIN